MNRLKLFEEFVNTDTALKKIYLAVKRSSGHRWWTFKGFASSKFFTQITDNNINDIKVNKDYPILNYNSEIINTLLKDKRIKESNIYNHPKFLHLSGSKKSFHELTKNNDNVPKTVYSIEDAIKKLTFPIIAKPAKGHSGIGIKIIKTKEELNDLDKSKFDTFSEYIDKAEEMRFFLFKGEPFSWMERNPMNEKAKNGTGDSDEQMNFSYTLRDVNKIPNDYLKVLKEFSIIYHALPFMCFDMMKSKDGKVYVIEPNTQPGVPFDSTIELYKKIYVDFYKKQIDSESLKKLDEYSKLLNDRTLKQDKNRFFIKK